MKALKIIGIIVVALIAVVVVIVLVQPSQGHIERSVVIQAPAPQVYSRLVSFESFNEWSPWAKMDPDAKYSYEGAAAGIGAKMKWDGETVGKGAQWIEETEENKRVKNAMSFEGMEGTYYAEFILSPEGEGTKVTWTYDGANNGFAEKAMWVVMKGMMENQFEQGLNDLKQLVETQPAPVQQAEMPADSTVVSQ